MSRYFIFFLGIFCVSTAYSVESESERNQKKAELDGICEEARQRALIPMKRKLYQECLSKKEKEESKCAEEADSYNGNRASGAPLFYDLPECEAAFEYRKSYRNAD